MALFVRTFYDRPPAQSSHPQLRPQKTGAADGNRTHVTCLEGRSSTIELRPHEVGFYPGGITPKAQGPLSESFALIRPLLKMLYTLLEHFYISV